MPLKDEDSSSMDLPFRKSSLVCLRGPNNAPASFLDVILEEFFKSEQIVPESNSMEEEINQQYTKEFLDTFELIENNLDPGARRFLVNPLWKRNDLIPTYDSEQGTKDALRRFLALERRVNLAKNSKLKEGYHGFISKHILS